MRRTTASSSATGIGDSVLATGPTAEAASGQPTVSRSAIPAFLVLLLITVATLWDGGFHLRHWALPAEFALLALTVACASARRGLLCARPLQVAVLAVWAFVVWDMLSALHAGSVASALEGAARSTVYAGIVGVVVLVGPAADLQRRLALTLLGTLSVVVCWGAAQVLLRGTDAFTAGRLEAPTGYTNASGAVFAMAVLGLVAVGAHRGNPPVLRAIALTLSAVGCGLLVLTQSRGAVLAAAAGAAVLVGLGPDRLRRLVFLAVSVLLVLPFLEALDAPWRASGFGQAAASAAAVDDAGRALLLVGVTALAVGTLISVFDHGLRASDRLLAHARRAVLALVACVALAGAVLAVAHASDLAATVREKVDEFRGATSVGPGGSRLTYGGGQRYDLWRIAMQVFADHPVTGVGEGNYARPYYQQRTSDRNLDDPHSLPLRLLAETGAVGLFLFAVFIGAAVVAVAHYRRGRAAPPWLVGPLAAIGAVGLVQSAVDWTWLVTSVFGFSVFALVLAGMMATTGTSRPRPVQRPWRLALAACSAGAALLVGVLYLSDAFERAAREAVTPAERLDAARTAARLNPWSVEARYLQASAQEDLGAMAPARSALQDALEVEPRNFVTLGLIGDHFVRRNRFAQARRYYDAALRLNPRDVGLRELRDQVAARVPAASR